MVPAGRLSAPSARASTSIGRPKIGVGRERVEASAVVEVDVEE